MSRAAPLLACLALALAGCGGSTQERPAADAPTGPEYGAVGDSYSNGEGVGAEAAWPAQLAERLGLDLVVNAAVSGWTTEQALELELPQLRRAQPDLATLQIGANDLVRGVPPVVFRERFRRLLRGIVAVVGGPRRVLVVTIPDFSAKPAGVAFARGRDLTAAIGAFNAIIRTVSGRQRVAVADVFAVSRRPTQPSPDGLHPSAAELRAWTDAIARVARRRWAPFVP